MPKCVIVLCREFHLTILFPHKDIGGFHAAFRGCTAAH
jgi:hypothetical protein